MNSFLEANKTFLSYSLILIILIPIFGIKLLLSFLGNIVLLLFLIPESPRWLIKNNNPEKGFNILTKISGKKIAEKEFIEIKNSIRKFKESESVNICVLDAGLTSEQIEKISSSVDDIKKAEWDIKVPGYKVLKKEWLKSQVSRAFIPKYFPELE